MTLDPDENRTLEAALACLIPADGDPDGRVAGDFVRGRLALHADAYRAGLALLVERGFADLSAEGQNGILREFEGHPFFALLVQHAIEGYYTGEAGFAVVGFRVTA